MWYQGLSSLSLFLRNNLHKVHPLNNIQFYEFWLSHTLVKAPPQSRNCVFLSVPKASSAPLQFIHSDPGNHWSACCHLPACCHTQFALYVVCFLLCLASFSHHIILRCIHVVCEQICYVLSLSISLHGHTNFFF